MSISVIVLAAGMSTRLRRPKQLLELDGEPVISHVVRAAAGSVGDDVMVVTGAHGEDIARLDALAGVRCVFNPRYAEGQASSIVAGVAALGSHVSGCVFLLGDQPGVTASAIDGVVGELERGAGIVQTRYADGVGHPVGFASTYFPELMRLTGDIGGREVISRHADVRRFLDFPDVATPDDIDTEADWSRITERGRRAP